MASGLSRRYGRNKLLEPLDGRAVILRVADRLSGAGLRPLAVTRSPEVQALMAREGIDCVIHDGPLKSDAIRVGLEALTSNHIGYLFMQADQPLILPESIKGMVARFRVNPERAVRLGFDGIAGSPVLFPALFRKSLLAYTGDRGGLDVLRREGIPCDVVQARHPWELWDMDTPDDFTRILSVYNNCRRSSQSSDPDGCSL